MSPFRFLRPAAAPLAAVLLSVALTTPAASAATSTWIGRELPEAAWRHAFRDASGKTHTLSEWKGQTLVVNFWATWCAPCREEMPRLARLHGALVPRGGVVVAISVDRDPMSVSSYLMKESVAVPAVIDGPDGLAKTLDLRQLPVTFLVDASGRIIDEVSGGSVAGLDRLAGRALTPTVTPAAAALGTAATGAVADGEGSPR